MPRIFRWRIAIPYLILLAVILSVFSSVVSIRIRQNETASRELQLLNTAQWLASQAQPYYQGDVAEEPLNQLAIDSSEAMKMTVIFMDSRGAILGTSLHPEQNPENPLLLPGVAHAQLDDRSVKLSKHFITAAVKIQGLDGEDLGLVYLQAPLSNDTTSLNWLLWLTIAAITVTAAALLVLTLILQEQDRRPIEVLTIATQQMSMGNFKNLEFPQNETVFTELTHALQNMAEKLGTQIDALTSERAKLSAVLDQMADGVLIADSEGRVQLLNPAAERLFRVSEKTGTGRSVIEVLRYHQLVELWQQVNQGKPQSTMLEIGPQHLILQVVGIPLKTSLPGSTMILFQDLTQLRRLETVRRDFISNVSHELRTPLASLKALADTLQEGALEDPPAARRFILRMETEIDNLAQLVNELLELSRIESGKVPLSFHRIQPCDLLRPAYERMVLQAERAALELRLDCQPNLPVVFADSDRISQVMINLVHNAIKFTPPGGKITISAYQEGDQIVFFVRDTGVGIAKKDLGRIFERFYKADRARTGGGTGLGLSIARHMIESHGGTIWAESEEGFGSTLYFSLPIA